MYDAAHTNQRRLVEAPAEAPGSLVQARYVRQVSGIASDRTEEERAKGVLPCARDDDGGDPANIAASEASNQTQRDVRAGHKKTAL
jgi:hypothetical protein